MIGMSKNEQGQDLLKKAVLDKFGHTLDSVSDYDALSLSISEVTGESVSPTTLKRLFGYIKPSTEPRPSTLSILARYVGYSGWSDFCVAQKLGCRQNSDISEDAVTAGRAKHFPVRAILFVIMCISGAVILFLFFPNRDKDVVHSQIASEADEITEEIMNAALDVASDKCGEVLTMRYKMPIVEYYKYVNEAYVNIVFKKLDSLVKTESNKAFSDGIQRDKCYNEVFSACREYCVTKLLREFPMDEYYSALDKQD